MSSKYRVFATDQFNKDIKKLKLYNEKKVRNKIKSYVFTKLSEEPHFGSNIKKLKDWTPETWRYRIGDLRLFYEIDETEKIVYIIALEPRNRAY